MNPSPDSEPPPPLGADEPRGAPSQRGPARLVRCPFCGSEHTRLESPFGSTLGFALYWCEGCRTAFEYLKWEDEPAR